MKLKKLTALLLAALMVLALAACGAKDGNTNTDTGDGPKNAEEAAARYSALMEQENAILSENTDLWEKVFLSADKGMTMQEDGKNYGDFLLDTIEGAKDQFTDEELTLLKDAASKISDIENELTALEEKFPEIVNEDTDGNGDMQKFPSFEGKDLDGNTVKSDELFAANTVTVVNFWFTTCSPCVGELSDLEALNQQLAALSSVSTPSRLTATKRPSPRRRTCWPRRAPPIRTCTSAPAVRPESLWRTSSLSPPPMWSIATATSWVTPSWAPSRRRSRRKRCKSSSIRRSQTARAEAPISKHIKTAEERDIVPVPLLFRFTAVKCAAFCPCKKHRPIL